MICKKCGTKNDSDAIQCQKCGAKLSAAKDKGSFFDFSISSVLIIIFSLIAVVFLILPSSRSISIIELVNGAPTVQGETAAALLEQIKKDQSIVNEKEKIDKNLAVLNNGGEAKSDMFIISSWTPEQAITVLEAANNSPDVDVPARVAGINERAQKVNDKEAEISALKGASAPDEEALQKMNQELDALKTDLNNYIMESIDALHPDDVDRGALGGIVREHRLIQPTIENIALILSILTLLSFVLTIIAWAAKLYRLRLITIIADMVLTIATFFVPLAVWSIEYKWPQEIFGFITYGFNFGSTFIFVVVCAMAVLITGFAYFSDIFTASKKS